MRANRDNHRTVILRLLILVLLLPGCAPTTTTPQVTGLTLVQAEAQLQAAGLQLGLVVEHFSAQVGFGRVVSQNPEALAMVSPGTAVNLAVSKGPAPVRVPDVVGLNRDSAGNTIRLAGLSVGDVGEQHDDMVPEEAIISQAPVAGTEVARGEPVDLVVSLGPAPVEPDVAFQAEPRSGPAPLTVRFSDVSDPGDYAFSSRQWDFGDGEAATYASPSYSYLREGLYHVTLTREVVGREEPVTVEDTITVLPSEGGGYEITADRMIDVPGGWFEMGDPYGNGYPSEHPVHDVYLSPYRIGAYEVTNAQFAAILNWAHSKGYLELLSGFLVRAYGQKVVSFDGSATLIRWNNVRFYVPDLDDESMDRHPVAEVTWHGAAIYCNWLSLYHGLEPCYDTTDWTLDLTRNGYHLPTEAQWERAAAWDGCQHWRVGTGEHSLTCETANYALSTSACNPALPDSFPYTTPVGAYAPYASPVGCFDMSGNVNEWCHDRFDYDFYSRGEAINPVADALGAMRVHRGGGHLDSEFRCRTARRGAKDPQRPGFAMGFRIARFGGEPYVEGEGEGAEEDDCEGEGVSAAE